MGIYGVDFYGTTFYGAPRYLEFDARPFTATPSGYGAIRLDWVNPAGAWDRLRVVRSSYGFPSYPDDGTIILEQDNAPSTSVTDSEVKEGKFFYYAIFVRETTNLTWIRAGDVIALPVADHEYGEHLFSLMPSFLQEADLDRVTPAQPQGPLERYLRVLGISLDHIRTEYETLRWLRDPESISGNLLPLLANQFGLPHEPAIGMRQTRVWTRDAVYLYRHKGTRLGVEAASSAIITGWGSRVTYSRNILRANDARGWYSADTVNDVASPDDLAIPAIEVVSANTSAMAISTAPTNVASPLPPWFGLDVEAGSDYTISAFLRPAATADAGITYRWFIDWYDQDGVITGTQGVGAAVATVDATWTKIESTFNAPLTAAYAVIGLESTSIATTASTVLLRRAQFEQSSIGTGFVAPRALVINFDPVRWNFIPNPSFENGIYGWDIIEGSAVTSDASIGDFGGNSLQLLGMLTSIPLGLATPGVPHVLSAYTDGAARLRAAIGWYAAADDPEPVRAATERTFSFDEGVNRIELADTAPANANFAKVTLDGAKAEGHALELDGTAGTYAKVEDVNLLDSTQASFDNVPFAGTVAPDDRYESWGSGGGTGVGAPGAASPMLIDLDKYKTDRHLFLPGMVGNYGQIPDVNLLDARVAHARVNGWAVNNNAQPATLIDEVASFSGRAVQGAADGTASSAAYYLLTSYCPPVVAGSTYTAAVKVRGTSGRRIRLDLYWLDSVDAVVGSVVVSTQVTLDGTGSGTVSVTGIAPTGAVKVRTILRYIESSTLPVGETFHWYDLVVRPGSDATFVPSTHIPGDIHVVADAQLDVSETGAASLVGRYASYTSANTEFLFNINAAGTLRFYRTIGTTGHYATATVNVTDPLARHRYEATWRQSDGRVQFFVDGVQLGADVIMAAGATGNVAPGRDLYIGSYGHGGGTGDLLHGRIYEAEVRDGIGGPVAARFDADDAPSRASTSWNDTQGNTWTIHQSAVLGIGKAEIRGGRPKKVAWLPGAAGNYFSVADVNLLDTNNAHCKLVGTGGWVTYTGVSVIERVTTQAYFSDGAVRFTADGVVAVPRVMTAKTPAASATQYTAGCWVKAASGQSIMIMMKGRDSAGAEVWSSAVVYFTATGGWQFISVTDTSTTIASIEVMPGLGGTPAAGTEMFIGAAVLRAGATAEFVPSHRITGDLDLRARVALKDWKRASRDGFLGRWGTNSSFAWTTNTSGAVRLDWVDSGGTAKALQTTATLTLGNQDDFWVRVVLDVNDEAATVGHKLHVYTSPDGAVWTLFETVTGAGATSVRALANMLTFGNFQTTAGVPTLGAFIEAEVRDGINGPIVARFDADDPAGFPVGAASGASYVDATSGHSVVLNASGDATTEIVARNTWMFSGSEYLVMPNRDEFNFGTDYSFMVLTAASTRSTLTDKRVFGKRVAGNSYSLYHAGVNGYRAEAETHGTTDARARSNDGLMHTVGMEVDRGVANAMRSLVDGVFGTSLALGAYSFTNASAFHIGTLADSASWAWRGEIAWNAVFRRLLTTSELDTLAAWDGTVATEPVWLRPLAVFYTNADDPLVRAAYENNEVLNLGTAVYGDLGWSIQEITDYGASTLKRNSVVTPPVGHMSMEITGNGTPPNNLSEWIVTSHSVGLVAPGETCSVSFAALTNSSGTPKLTPEIVFFDAAGGEVSRSMGVAQSVNNLNGGLGYTGFTRVSHSAVVPAGAALAAIAIHKTVASGSGTAGQAYFIDAAIIRKGADTGYVPSLRIRHDLDIRADFSASNPDAVPGLIVKDNGYRLLGHPQGVRLDVYTNGALAFGVLPFAAVVAGDRVRIRVTHDGTTASLYKDVDGAWQLETSVALAGNPDASRATLLLGARDGGGSGRLFGEVHHAEVRDGIDGPVVLDVDFNAAPWVLGDTALTREEETGQDVTLVGTAEIIEHLVPLAIDRVMLEEGSVAGAYFDGDFFGADWLWAGIANASASKYYPGRAVRNVRVRELLPHYLPLNQEFILNYVGGAPASGRAVTGDEGNVGVGTYGIMPFGQ